VVNRKEGATGRQSDLAIKRLGDGAIGRGNGLTAQLQEVRKRRFPSREVRGGFLKAQGLRDLVPLPGEQRVGGFSSPPGVRGGLIIKNENVTQNKNNSI
jgi:hypothetical protein